MTKYWLFMICSVLVASISQMLLKKATLIEYKNHIREYLNVWVICGYLLMFVSTILVIFAYKGLEYKNGAVIDSLGYIFVLVLGRIFFKENITKNKITGVILILIGVIIFYI